MRLIDADKLLEYFDIGSEEARKENRGEIITAEDIDNFSTAYDVDRVAENIRNSPTDEDGITCYVYGKQVITKEYAINFIKQGGVSSGD